MQRFEAVKEHKTIKKKTIRETALKSKKKQAEQSLFCKNLYTHVSKHSFKNQVELQSELASMEELRLLFLFRGNKSITKPGVNAIVFNIRGPAYEIECEI